jgi:hypothetical protein
MECDMRKYIVVIALIFISSCVSPDVNQGRFTTDVLLDLGSENNRLAAELFLDVYKEDLSILTYDSYLNYITKNEAPSAKGIAAIIKSADLCCFRAKKDCFVLALYYAKERRFICDDSRSQWPDTTRVLGANDTIPDLCGNADRMLLK